MPANYHTRRKASFFQILSQKFYFRLIYPFIARYLKKDRPYRYKGFNLIILTGIFHPAFFFSSSYFFSFINTLDLENKKCIEVGCGSGLLSLLMLRKKGIVTATDVQERAITNTRINFEKNRNQFQTEPTLIHSDLFDQLPVQKFDVLIVNPPYYFHDARKETEQAWFCGSNGEYFTRFFGGLKNYCHASTDLFMILAENCEIERIETIARQYGFHFSLADEKKILWETSYIFRITYNPAA